MMEIIKQILEIPLVGSIVAFVIVQVISIFCFNRKREIKEDLNHLISTIEKKLHNKQLYQFPLLSRWTRKKLGKSTIAEIESYLTRNHSLEALNKTGIGLINRIKSIK